jgi:hypothetical protein
MRVNSIRQILPVPDACSHYEGKAGFLPHPLLLLRAQIQRRNEPRRRGQNRV